MVGSWRNFRRGYHDAVIPALQLDQWIESADMQKLSDIFTHFEITNPESKPIAILIRELREKHSVRELSQALHKGDEVGIAKNISAFFSGRDQGTVEVKIVNRSDIESEKGEKISLKNSV